MDVPRGHLGAVEFGLGGDESCGIDHLHRLTVGVNGREVCLAGIGVTKRRRGQKVDRHPLRVAQVHAVQRDDGAHVSRRVAVFKARAIQHATSPIHHAEVSPHLHEHRACHVAGRHVPARRHIAGPAATVRLGVGVKNRKNRETSEREEEVDGFHWRDLDKQILREGKDGFGVPLAIALNLCNL